MPQKIESFTQFLKFPFIDSSATQKKNLINVKFQQKLFRTRRENFMFRIYCLCLNFPLEYISLCEIGKKCNSTRRHSQAHTDDNEAMSGEEKNFNLIINKSQT